MMGKLTIAICSNRFDKIKDYSLDSLLKVKNPNFKILLILDSAITNIDNSFLDFLKEGIEFIESDQAGLSKLRNIALARCDTKYILFIDDDVTLDNSAIETIVDNLEKGCDIVGLKLVAPNDDYKNKWYITPSQLHYVGVHSSQNNTSIWGACMAFNMSRIKSQNILFPENLGRQKGNFMSGEDSVFVQRLKESGATEFLAKDHFAIHHIDKSRFEFVVMCKRVLWQGITEVVRHNVTSSIKKEFDRNFGLGGFRNSIVGCMWFIVFCVGLLSGYFYLCRYE